MAKRLFASTLISIPLLLVLVQHHSVTSAMRLDWSDMPTESVAVDDSTSTDETSTDEQTAATDSTTVKKKKGNGFARAISAPFRALGRLFGGSRDKKNDQQARRSSEKDVKQFESTFVTRIKDARVESPAPAEQQKDSPEATLAVSPLSVNITEGRAFINTGNFEGAIAKLSSAASLDSHNAEVQNLLGVAFEGKGMRQRALDSFENAVKLSKNNAQYLNNYGFLLYLKGDLEAATKYLKRATKFAPNDARIWNNLGLTQCKREKFDDAYVSFARAVGEFNGHLNVAAQLSNTETPRTRLSTWKKHKQ